MSIPIVNAAREIVGWTDVLPKNADAALRHNEAERLVGGQVTAAFVGINDPELAKRAGAPDGWSGTWRCIGLCSTAALTRGDNCYVIAASKHPGEAAE